jgi:hypothetical protein
MVLAISASWLRNHDLAMWSLDGLDLGITGRHNYLNNMANKASRQSRKAALAALPNITARELFGLKLMDAEWNPTER